jgi:hypothetical protein
MESLHLSCVGLAAAGACCTAAAKPRAVTIELFGSLLMFVAMADTGVRLNLLPAPAWALALILTALVTAILRNPARSGVQQFRHNGMTVHRNIGTILMAALLVHMDVHKGTAVAGGHAGHNADILSALLALGALGYTFASLWLAVRGASIPRNSRAESALMGLSVLLMATGVLA